MSINGFIDFRSDTVTQPTPAMREAMATAELGDDVFGDDPTVNALQEKAAAMLGKEAGLFVSTGTMGNLIALLAHCGRGEEIIMGDASHTFNNERAGLAALGGLQPRVLQNQADGTLRLADISAAIRAEDPSGHAPVTGAISIENTQNVMGGAALPAEYMNAVAQLAHSRGLVFHVDGARIFNAAIALGVPAKELVAGADSITFCLSKGLSAPVGSVLCGSKAFIYKAHKYRKMVGGGMRQAGVLAAAGIVALDQMVNRLGDDHANARALAQGIAKIPGLRINVNSVQTNMVYFDVADDAPFGAAELCQRAGALRVRMLPVGGRRIRAVTHAWVSRDEVDAAVDVLKEVMK